MGAYALADDSAFMKTSVAVPVTVVNGGTGTPSMTDHGVLIGSGTNAITPLTTATNGQILVGSTGADPVFVVLDCASNLTCTLGAGSLEINVDDAFSITNLIATYASSTNISSTGGAWFATGGGNVGIGTSTPSALLEVSGTGQQAVKVTDTTSGITAGIWAGTAQGLIGTYTNTDLRLITNGTSKMTIEADGNVGIGDTTPTYKLDVDGTTRITGALTLDTALDFSDYTNATASTNITFTDDAISVTDPFSVTNLTATYASSTNLTVSGDAWFTSGNIGIGTTAPGAKLVVAGGPAHFIGSGSASSGVGLEVGYTGSRSQLLSYDRDGSVYKPLNLAATSFSFEVSGTEKVTIDSTGNIGIGSTAPGHKLQVIGTAGLSTGTAWTNTSDYRFKNIKAELTGTSLAKILSLRPISFEWNELHKSKFGEDLGLNYGFIAQEVEEIIPEFVSIDDEGYYWYNPSGIEAILTGAMQEQQEQIKELKNLIKNLRDEVNLLKKE